MVNTEITIIDSSEELRRSIEGALAEKPYQIFYRDAGKLENHLQDSNCLIVIVDLDTVPKDILFFRHLKRTHPGLKIIVASRQPYHPDLQEAMSHHIFASISQPVDPDEVMFLLKNILDENEPS